MTAHVSRAVILVGHGGLPKDCPQELVMTLRRLEGQRKKTGGERTQEEIEVDRKIRTWPRTPANDPYRAGLEKLAESLRPHMDGRRLTIAYNEFCAPTLEDAAADLIGQGVGDLTVVPSMYTQGGSHAEIEIPDTIARLRQAHPSVTVRYAWPFDQSLVARMLAEHLSRFRQ